MPEITEIDSDENNQVQSVEESTTVIYGGLDEDLPTTFLFTHPSAQLTSNSSSLEGEGATQAKVALNNTPRRRTRQVFGPVKGNNSSGRRGKLRCTECRKVKAKCIYASEIFPCERCDERGVICVKMWGPKHQNDLEAEPTSALEAVELIIPSGGLNTISFLTEFPASVAADEATAECFRRMYGTIVPDSVFGVFLRLLWPRYGLFLANDPFMQTAGMVMAIHPDLGPTALPLFRQRFSHLQRLLARVLETNSLNETHLMALFFILITSRSNKWKKEEFDWTNILPAYLNAVVMFIRHFKTTLRTQSQYLEFWPFLLNCVIQDIVYHPWNYSITSDTISNTMWTVFSLWRDSDYTVHDIFPSFHWKWHGYRFFFAHEIFFALRTCLLSYLITPLTGHSLSESRRQEIEKAIPLINQRIEHFITTHETVVTILDPMKNPFPSAWCLYDLEFGALYCKVVLSWIFLAQLFLQKIVNDVTATNPEDVLPFICRLSRELAQGIAEGKKFYFRAHQPFYIIIFLAAAFLPPHWEQEKAWIIHQLSCYDGALLVFLSDPVEALERFWVSEQHAGDFYQVLLASGVLTGRVTY